jgi:hypothetical protein
MSNVSIRTLRPLEQWSSTLAFAAGILFLGHAVVRAIEAFSTASPPPDVFGPAGYVAAGLALLGLVPALSYEAPNSSRLAATLSLGTVSLWALIACWTFGAAAGMLPPTEAVFPAALFAVVILSMLLIYLVFATVSLRADSHSRTLGLLLLVPAGILAFLMVGGVVLSVAPEEGAVAVGGGLALSHAAIGGALSVGRTDTDRVAPAAEATRE